jgi:hypothetical protein
VNALWSSRRLRVNPTDRCELSHRNPPPNIRAGTTRSTV